MTDGWIQPVRPLVVRWNKDLGEREAEQIRRIQQLEDRFMETVGNNLSLRAEIAAESMRDQWAVRAPRKATVAMMRVQTFDVDPNFNVIEVITTTGKTMAIVPGETWLEEA